MDWKETVELCPDGHCQPYCHEAQAKITGDIAYKAGFKKALDTVVATRQYDVGFKAGRDSFLDDVGNATIPLSEVYEKGRKVGVGEGRKETWDTAITAAIQGAREEVVEKLEAWRAQGTHLISEEAIKAIKEWGLDGD